MELYNIECGTFKLDGGAMFGVVPKVIWNSRYPADENNLCNWALRALLVVENDRKVLIDCGCGDKQDDKFFKHYYLDLSHNLKSSLKKKGIKPEDITDLVLTHLHFDHGGGAVEYNENRTELNLVFPNATHWIGKSHWDLANNPNDREKASFLPENFLPIEEKGKLELIEKDTVLFPGFELRLFNGHTDGQILPFINYNSNTIVYMADLLPSTAHIPMPYVMSYDSRPMLTMQEKKGFFKEALEKNYTLFFEHDFYNECCNLQDTIKGVRANETFSLEEFIHRNSLP
ncbi:MBL fold metallo-hydrolase [Bacteroidota bacterium]